MESSIVLRVESYKYGNRLYRVWEDTRLLSEQEEGWLVAYNYRTRVWQSDGKEWVTAEPAFCFFSPEYWFNIIWLPRNERFAYYCNMASPCERTNEAIRYIDYDLDLLVHPEGKSEWVDREEFARNRLLYGYPFTVVERIERESQRLEKILAENEGPFSPCFRTKWLARLNEP